MKLPFKYTSKSLHGNEIDQAIKKLKELYKKYAEIYGGNVFNLNAFEKRYINALKNKTDINVFLHAEISVFEELKQRTTKSNQKISENKGSDTSYSKIADRIIEENLSKIKKYRYIDIHPDAEDEVKYLYGAVFDFYYNTWTLSAEIMRKIANSTFDRQLEKLEHDFSYYIIPIKGAYSRAIDDYLFVLSRKNPIDNEKAAVNFIKYGGILLNNCERLMNEAYNILMSSNDESDANRMKYLLEVTRKIINDFRLMDIRSF